MSIWGTILDFHADDHAEECGRWVPCTREEADASGQGMYGNDGRCWRYDDTLPCTCAAGPLVYQKSHVMPTADDQRDGYLDLASIASHIGPDREYRDAGGTHLPYLRVSLRGTDDEPDTVVLDRKKVHELHATLGSWLANCDPEPDSPPIDVGPLDWRSGQ